MQTKNKDTNKIVNYDYELGKLTRGKEEKKNSENKFTYILRGLLKSSWSDYNI